MAEMMLQNELIKEVPAATDKDSGWEHKAALWCESLDFHRKV